MVSEGLGWDWGNGVKHWKWNIQARRELLLDE